MDQQGQAGGSPSVGLQHQSGIKEEPSPGAPTTYPQTTATDDASIGLGLSLTSQPPDQQVFQAQQQPTDFQYSNESFPIAPEEQQPFDPSQQQQGEFGGQNQPFLGQPSFDEGGDFSLFPPTSQGEQYDTPLFDQPTLNPSDINNDANMSAAQIHHAPTPPHLLGKMDPHGSPSFNHGSFSSPPLGHSRHASLGPEAALLPNQMNQFTQPQFTQHRRSPSEYSDISSAAPSPALLSQDSFDPADSHSPMQRPVDSGMYTEVLGIGNFSLSDNASPGRSPSHSPAISPRLLPSQGPDMSQQAGPFGLAPPPIGTPSFSSAEAFPPLHPSTPQMGSMAPPSIAIDYAPNAMRPENGKGAMDADSLTPPDNRGRSRKRAVTDPYNSGLSRPLSPGQLSPNLNPDSRESSRSLSPLDRQQAGRRRQSTSAVPNNVIALRLADPEYSNSNESGNAKRVQKHPATFQCTLCPKRFTRAYNLRSHLRTHTDERPFVCTVCGKAFARQHDRKRHESLHSGEKKFVCKGDLKSGNQWGCGRKFARADALGRHFRSEAGRICIRPLLDEEMMERQRLWQEQKMQQSMAAAQSMVPIGMDPSGAYPIDPSGAMILPQALLAQYPALAGMSWNPNDVGNAPMEDELSGRSSFEASDYDDGEDTGYVSGPGTGFGEGSMPQNYGEIGYASDYGHGRP